MKRDERFDLEKASEIYKTNGSITDSAKQHCKDLDIEYGEMYRNALSRYIRKGLPSLKEEFEGYSFSAIGTDGRVMSIEDYCKFYGFDFSKIKSYKSVTHNGTPYYNILFNSISIEESGISNEFLEEIVKKYIKPVTVEIPVYYADTDFASRFADRLIITDVHVGMSTEGGRNTKPLYDVSWNRETLMERLKDTVQFVIENQVGSVLYIDELGDFMDGLGGVTTRKGHSLPQNMSDKEAHEVGIEFKIKLIENLLPYYKKIVCNNITSDNHSFLFGYFVNSTVKKIIEAKYENVEYNILERFLNHYSVGKHTFILSHGKDEEALKFGFKPFLDSKQAEKIDQYCKEHGLYNGNNIEFSKGDSHQCVFDYTTSNDFDYMNYPAFSPPSNWVSTNFKKSKSGFVMQNLSLDGEEKILNLKWFK